MRKMDMGNTICWSDVIPHSAAIKGMALLGRALAMVELMMAVMQVVAM